jgi:HEAT repeat protein
MATTAGSRLFSVLSPLRDGGECLLSQAIRLLADQEKDLKWAEKLLQHYDPRFRANVIEGLWESGQTGLRELFLRAARDTHHRVAANAVYGLYLMDDPCVAGLLEDMKVSRNPRFRRAAAWVIRKMGKAHLRTMLKPLIRDENALVRGAAFQTLGVLNVSLHSGSGQ